MKKLILLLGVLCSLSFAQDYQQIIDFYKEQLGKDNKVEISFVEKKEFDKMPFEALILDIKINDTKQREVVFYKDNLIFNDILDIKTKTSFKSQIEKQMQEKSNEKILQTLKNDRSVISLGKNKEGEIFVFSDPMCPYCKKHLETINADFLKNYRINFIFVGMLGKESLDRATILQKELKYKTNDRAKLELINTFFEKDIKYQEPSVIDKEKTNLAFQKYRNMGVSYVPYIIEVKKKP